MVKRPLLEDPAFLFLCLELGGSQPPQTQQQQASSFLERIVLEIQREIFFIPNTRLPTKNINSSSDENNNLKKFDDMASFKRAVSSCERVLRILSSLQWQLFRPCTRALALTKYIRLLAHLVVGSVAQKDSEEDSSSTEFFFQMAQLLRLSISRCWDSDTVAPLIPDAELRWLLRPFCSTSSSEGPAKSNNNILDSEHLLYYYGTQKNDIEDDTMSEFPKDGNYFDNKANFQKFVERCKQALQMVSKSSEDSEEEVVKRGPGPSPAQILGYIAHQVSRDEEMGLDFCLETLDDWYFNSWFTFTTTVTSSPSYSTYSNCPHHAADLLRYLHAKRSCLQSRAVTRSSRAVTSSKKMEIFFWKIALHIGKTLLSSPSALASATNGPLWAEDLRGDLNINIDNINPTPNNNSGPTVTSTTTTTTKNSSFTNLLSLTTATGSSTTVPINNNNMFSSGSPTVPNDLVPSPKFGVALEESLIPWFLVPVKVQLTPRKVALAFGPHYTNALHDVVWMGKHFPDLVSGYVLANVYFFPIDNYLANLNCTNNIANGGSNYGNTNLNSLTSLNGTISTNIGNSNNNTSTSSSSTVINASTKSSSTALVVQQPSSSSQSGKIVLENLSSSTASGSSSTEAAKTHDATSKSTTSEDQSSSDSPNNIRNKFRLEALRFLSLSRFIQKLLYNCNLLCEPSFTRVASGSLDMESALACYTFPTDDGVFTDKHAGTFSFYEAMKQGENVKAYSSSLVSGPNNLNTSTTTRLDLSPLVRRAKSYYAAGAMSLKSETGGGPANNNSYSFTPKARSQFEECQQSEIRRSPKQLKKPSSSTITTTAVEDEAMMPEPEAELMMNSPSQFKLYGTIDNNNFETPLHSVVCTAAPSYFVALTREEEENAGGDIEMVGSESDFAPKQQQERPSHILESQKPFLILCKHLTSDAAFFPFWMDLLERKDVIGLHLLHYCLSATNLKMTSTTNCSDSLEAAGTKKKKNNSADHANNNNKYDNNIVDPDELGHFAGGYDVYVAAGRSIEARNIGYLSPEYTGYNPPTAYNLGVYPDPHDQQQQQVSLLNGKENRSFLGRKNNNMSPSGESSVDCCNNTNNTTIQNNLTSSTLVNTSNNQSSTSLSGENNNNNGSNSMGVTGLAAFGSSDSLASTSAKKRVRQLNNSSKKSSGKNSWSLAPRSSSDNKIYEAKLWGSIYEPNILEQPCLYNKVAGTTTTITTKDSPNSRPFSSSGPPFSEFQLSSSSSDPSRTIFSDPDKVLIDSFYQTQRTNLNCNANQCVAIPVGPSTPLSIGLFSGGGGGRNCTSNYTSFFRTNAVLPQKSYLRPSSFPEIVLRDPVVLEYFLKKQKEKQMRMEKKRYLAQYTVTGARKAGFFDRQRCRFLGANAPKVLGEENALTERSSLTSPKNFNNNNNNLNQIQKKGGEFNLNQQSSSPQQSPLHRAGGGSSVGQLQQQPSLEGKIRSPLDFYVKLLAQLATRHRQFQPAKNPNEESEAKEAAGVESSGRQSATASGSGSSAVGDSDLRKSTSGGPGPKSENLETNTNTNTNVTTFSNNNIATSKTGVTVDLVDHRHQGAQSHTLNSNTIINTEEQMFNSRFGLLSLRSKDSPSNGLLSIAPFQNTSNFRVNFNAEDIRRYLLLDLSSSQHHAAAAIAAADSPPAESSSTKPSESSCEESLGLEEDNNNESISILPTLLESRIAKKRKHFLEDVPEQESAVFQFNFQNQLNNLEAEFVTKVGTQVFGSSSTNNGSISNTSNLNSSPLTNKSFNGSILPKLSRRRRSELSTPRSIFTQHICCIPISKSSTSSKADSVVSSISVWTTTEAETELMNVDHQAKSTDQAKSSTTTRSSSSSEQDLDAKYASVEGVLGPENRIRFLPYDNGTPNGTFFCNDLVFDRRTGMPDFIFRKLPELARGNVKLLARLLAHADQRYGPSSLDIIEKGAVRWFSDRTKSFRESLVQLIRVSDPRVGYNIPPYKLWRWISREESIPGILTKY